MPFEVLEQALPEAPHPLVLIIDDDLTSRLILDRIVRNIHPDIVSHTFGDPVQAMSWLDKNQPDLILVDYLMQGLTGLEVLTRIRHMPRLEDVPVVMVTVANEKTVRYQVLDAGATDFISKPIDPYECRVRCHNLLSMRLHEKIVLSRAQSLEKAVADATHQIREREQETLFRLAKAGEYRDSDTGNHVLRMARYARMVAEALGLPADHCERIEIAAPMHDIGKIGIPDHILLKPGKLTAEEFKRMQHHPRIGYNMLHGSRSEFIAMAAEISLGHHEKFDGSGYPGGLVGTAIPLESRIVAIADVYDALTSVRPYKSAWSSEQALDYISGNSGSHFDPQCVAAFLRQHNRIRMIQVQMQDPPAGHTSLQVSQ